MAPKPADRLQRLREDGYKVKVTHWRRPLDPDELMGTLQTLRAKGTTPSPKGGATQVGILDGNGTLLARGEAECSDVDTFSRRIGLDIALGRAEKTLGRLGLR